MTSTRWSRRSALVLGLSALGLGLGVERAPATVSSVVLGGLRFDVPLAVQPAVQIPGLATAWSWQGVAPAATGSAPGTIVLARADLDSTDAEEILGLLLAGTTGGQLPGLLLEPRRVRSLGGDRGDQVRIDLSYQASRSLRYRGTLMVLTRPQPPAAVLVVLGDDDLTAGTVDGVLDSRAVDRVIRTLVRAWASSSITLLVASAGLFAVAATSTTTSTARMAVAAAVLSALSSLAGLLVTDVAARTLPRRVLWGGTVAAVWALGTAVLVGLAAGGVVPALLAGLPWLVGAAPVVVLGARLPRLHGLGGRPVLRRIHSRVRSSGLPDER